MAEKTDGYRIEDDIVTFCGNGGCCPTADFSQKGKVIFRGDNGEEIPYTLEQYAALEQFILKNHGHI